MVNKDIGQGMETGTVSRGRDDYYTSTGRKISDFCIGFFAFWGLTIIALISQWILIAIGIKGYIAAYMFQFFGMGTFALSILAISLAFIKKRRFIGIGLIIAYVIPMIFLLLVLGACVLTLSGLQ